YCVSSLGVTGVRKGEFKGEVYDFLNRDNQFSSVPVAVGFGIASDRQIDHLKPYCDGVIVGSAIVSEIEKLGDRLLNPNHQSEAFVQIKEFLISLTGEKRQ